MANNAFTLTLDDIKRLLPCERRWKIGLAYARGFSRSRPFPAEMIILSNGFEDFYYVIRGLYRGQDQIALLRKIEEGYRAAQRKGEFTSREEQAEFVAHQLGRSPGDWPKLGLWHNLKWRLGVQ